MQSEGLTATLDMNVLGLIDQVGLLDRALIRDAPAIHWLWAPLMQCYIKRRGAASATDERFCRATALPTNPSSIDQEKH